MWAVHDRIESIISEETCGAEIDSFTKHGQLVAALAGLVAGNEGE